MNLMEAFKALDKLNEDVFTVDTDGIKKLQDFVQNDDTVDELDVFSLDAEPDTVIDENECHVGDAILDCCICHSKIFKPVAEVVVDEESQVANKGEECPYCYSVEGYKVVGEVKPAEEVAEEARSEEDIDEVNISTNDVDIEIEDDDESEEKAQEVEIDEETEEVTEAVDLAAKDNTVAGILRQHMDELSSIFDPNELRNKVIEIVDSSDIADKPVADKLKKALFSKKSVGALLSTIGTYLTGEKVVKTGKYAKAARNESKGKYFKESSDITLEAEYETYPDGNITSTRVTGTDEFDAFANLMDKVGSYVTFDDVLDMQDEGATIEDVVQQIQLMNGDGSDFIFSIKNITTGKKYFDLNESCRRKSIKESTYRKYKSFKRNDLRESKRNKLRESEESIDDEETIGDKLKKYQMWVDYDMEHYGKVSETTQKIIDEAGLQLIKDQYGDYEVSVGSYKAESFKRSHKGKVVKEGLDSIEITSDDLTVSIETDDEKDNEEVAADVVEEPCDECSEEQVVAPVDEETKEEIEFDVDDIDENAIEDAVEECLTESFSNVKFFKCSNLTSRKNRIIVEGILGFKSGKKKNTSFVFRPSLKTESVVKFRGYNKDLKESVKSITLNCKKTGKKVIAESLKVRK